MSPSGSCAEFIRSTRCNRHFLTQSPRSSSISGWPAHAESIWTPGRFDARMAMLYWFRVVDQQTRMSSILSVLSRCLQLSATRYSGRNCRDWRLTMASRSGSPARATCCPLEPLLRRYQRRLAMRRRSTISRICRRAFPSRSPRLQTMASRARGTRMRAAGRCVCTGTMVRRLSILILTMTMVRASLTRTIGIAEYEAQACLFLLP